MSLIERIGDGNWTHCCRGFPPKSFHLTVKSPSSHEKPSGASAAVATKPPSILAIASATPRPSIFVSRSSTRATTSAEPTSVRRCGDISVSARVWIGTSGWHYKHWLGNFYPEKLPASKMLAHYVQHFDTVELNNSFYHLPKRPALESWRNSTPEGFCFAAKGSRFLTHMKKLKDPEQGLKRFFDCIEILDTKLGPVLFQLPPNWELDHDRLAIFLDCLPKYHRYAFEFRNDTWSVPLTYDLLARHNVAYCAFHLAGVQSPIEITAEFTYVRLHGPGGRYQGSYDDAALHQWAERIQEWQRTLKAVYVYFDNDQAGYAAGDALRLKQILHTG